MDYDVNIPIKEEIIEIQVDPVVSFGSQESAGDSDIDSKSDFINENPSTSYVHFSSDAFSEYALDDAGNLVITSFGGKEIKNELLPTDHIKTEDPSDVNQFKCSICKQILPSLQNFKLHFIGVHKGAEPMTNIYNTNSNDKEIQNTSQQKEFDEKRPFICNLCNKTFDSKKNLYNHKRITHAPPSAAKKCTVCDKQFRTKFHLDIHMKSVHATVLHHCDICNKECTSRRYLLKHRRTHKNTRHGCQVCEKTYKSKDELRRHTKKFHIIEKDWSNITNSSENLPQVQELSLKQECIDNTDVIKTPKSYKCLSCEKIFASKYTLRDHKRNVHAPPEAARECALCCKSFKSMHHLRIHNRCLHDDNLYGCDICGKEFKSRNYLMKHRRTHIDTQFSCTLCPKVFKCRDSVRKHMKRVHILPCTFENHDEPTEEGNIHSNSDDDD